MNNKDKNQQQHAMTSFALLGGMLVSPRPRTGRMDSRPPDIFQSPKKPR